MILRNREKIGELIGKDKIQDISTPSYRFAIGSNRNKLDVLSSLFLPNDNKGKSFGRFESAFRQAISGQGNESNNILTLHSSALLALLCFFNVSEENVLKIDEPKELKGTVFDKVFFEVENIVSNPNDRNSSIDIALYSSKDSIMLLLESKFTEPLNGKDIGKVNEKYSRYLCKLGEFDIIEKPKDTFKCNKVKVRNKPKLIYYEGIKQMIAHLIGAETGPASQLKDSNDFKKEQQEKYAELFCKARNNSNIYLGTILFENKGFYEGDEWEMIEQYKALYRKCMEVIAKDCNEVHLLTEPLSYQEVFRNENLDLLTPQVKDFYHFG